jgi:DNA-3-methyladenine glycosylase I
MRCAWAQSESMWAYHDQEWGFPVHDDRKHFEFMVLEGAQAGLSWSTILNKREGYRTNFAAFEPTAVARFTPAKVNKMLLDPGIVRNRLKIESCVKNAKLFLNVQEELGSFDAYIWSFVDGAPIVNAWQRGAQLPARSPQSDALSKDMIGRGFKFCGSTIMYAHMQACGLINDHLVECFRYKPCLKGTPRTGSRRPA